MILVSAAAAKSLWLCPTLCDPIDGSPSGSPVPGILQARTLEWVAISFSNAWKWKVKVKSFSHVWPLGTPWTAAYQAPPSMGFSRQEYWSGVPFLAPGGLPNPGIEPESLASPPLAGRFFATGATWEAPRSVLIQWLIHKEHKDLASLCQLGIIWRTTSVPEPPLDYHWAIT